MNIKARIGLSVAVIATVLSLFLAIAAIAGPEDKPNVCQNLCEAYKDSGCCDKPDDVQCRITKNIPWQFKSCQASNGNKKIQDLACKTYEPCKFPPILPPIGEKSVCKIKCTYGDNQVITRNADGSRCCLYDPDNSKFVAPDDICNGAIEKEEAFIKKDIPNSGKVKCELDGPVATSITCKPDPKC